MALTPTSIASSMLSAATGSIKNAPLFGGFLDDPQATDGKERSKKVIFADSRYAHWNYGLNNQQLYRNFPYFQFEYFIRFNFNKDPYILDKVIPNFFSYKDMDLSALYALAKDCELPSATIATETLNQYNRKKIIQKSIEYKPIKMSFFDVKDGKTMALWRMWYSYYFGDGVVNETGNKYTPKLENGKHSLKLSPDDVISERTNPYGATYGYNLASVKNSRNLIDSIELCFMASKDTYTSITIVNPMITGYEHTKLDYSSSELIEISYTFSYEYIIYSKPAKIVFAEHEKPLTVETSGAIGGGGQYEIFIPASVYAPLAPEVKVEQATEKSIFETNPILRGVATQAKSTVGNLPNDISSAVIRGINTGDYSLKPNPVDAIKNIARNADSNVKGQGTQAVGTAVKAATNTAIVAAIGGISSVFNSMGGDKKPPEGGTGG